MWDEGRSITKSGGRVEVKVQLRIRKEQTSGQVTRTRLNAPYGDNTEGEGSGKDSKLPAEDFLAKMMQTTYLSQVIGSNRTYRALFCLSSTSSADCGVVMI
jgi:hypothetical protein